jgi:membrane protease YdiL (CAAX protease family)
MLMDLIILAYSAATVLMVIGCLMGAGCAIWGFPVPLWPPRRNRLVSWTGTEVLVAFAAVELLIPLVFQLFLHSSGQFQWLYEATGGNFEPQFGGNQDEKLFRHLGLWETFLGFPFKLLLLGILLHVSSDFRPYQLGFTKGRFWQMLTLGCLVWLVCGLSCDLLHLFMSHGYALVFPQQQEVHAIMKIAQEHPTAAEWVLLFSSAVIIAPFMEEFLFRGLLLRWLNVSRRGTFITLSIALGVAVLTRYTQMETALRDKNWAALMDALAPLLFVALVIVGIEALTWLKLDSRKIIQWRAILASSLIFAVAHANVWPSPLALFVFAICLAWVATRTQSIIPCIVAHGLFNLVACMELVAGLLREYLPYCSGR